jgi:hypothetical protein
MAVSIDLRMQMTVLETVSGAGLSGTVTIPQDALNFLTSLHALSSPAVTKDSFIAQALTAGAATIDLTSMPNALGTAAQVTFSGLKVQCMIIYAPATNTGTITMSRGASNGYGLNAAGDSFSIRCCPGFRAVMFFDDEPPDVGGSAKTIDLAGTGTETLYIGFGAG